MRLRGGRTGKRAVICENLELTGLMRPFDPEIWYGERVAVLGSNGSGSRRSCGCSAGRTSRTAGSARLGARVVPGPVRSDPRPARPGRTAAPEEILMTEHALLRNEAMAALARYELPVARGSRLRTLSGRPAGTAADPAAGAGGLDAAAARRANRQPRPGQRRGAAGGPGVLPGHGAGGDPRSLVRPVFRPVPCVRWRTGMSRNQTSPVWDETRVVRPR